MKYKLLVRTIEIFLGLGLVSLIFWLAVYDINPSGLRVIEHSANNTNSLVDGPGPSDRVLGNFKEGDERYWEIGVDPIYFDLYIPRLYQEIDMTVEYQSQGQDLIELGGLGSSEGWQITLKPGNNEILNNLSWLCKQISKVMVCKNPNRELPDFTNLNDFKNYQNYNIVGYHFKFDEELGIDVEDWTQDLVLDEFDYLLTTYQPPVEQGDGWKQMSATFGAHELWLKGHIYKFMISAPGMDKSGAQLKVRKVVFTIYKEPISFNNIQIKIKRFLSRNLEKLGF